jgi:hypothetical protein
MNDATSWEHYIRRYREPDVPWQASADSFLRVAKDPIEVIRRGMHSNDGVEVLASLDLTSRIDAAERIKLFPEIFGKCLSQKFGLGARAILLSLPPEWLLENLETACINRLSIPDDEDFIMMLGILRNFDMPMAIRVATHALKSEDPEIRALAEGVVRREKPLDD